ncbi:hypothetical protein [Ekhidna sp. To15]|uniref:hypothetical protein n=1 Tax=Ekhidna sp. To15 TaxID=3395267 RepID=UPI003F525C1F
MKKYFNILIAILIVSPLLAQVRQERDFKRSFAVPENAKVEVVSKYGEVIVRTWNLDSVRFEVVVRAEGKNSSAVSKSMSRVDVKFRKVGSVISAVTEIGSSGGIFGNVINEVGGALGSNKLKVDYQVWMPKGVMLSVENKYGDLYMANLDGRVDLDISHGDIKASNLSSSLNLKHSFGKASFGKLNDGIFTLRGADITIDEASNLNIESGSSEIRVDKIGRIQLNSRNDKIHLLDAEEIMCEGSFTNLTSDLLRGSARLDFSYGDIYLSRIVKDFNRIDITGKSTDINLILNQASYIKTYIKGPEDQMILPNSMLTMQRETFSDEDKISLSGFVGNTNTRHSQLNVEADGGELIVAIKDTPIFVDKD